MEGHGHHHQVQVEAGSRKQRPFVAGDGSRSRAAKPRPRVVRAAVDEDLYIVPSDMSRKKKGVPLIFSCCIYLTHTYI